MIDRGRRNRRIAAAICISLVINGLQFAGIRRLVSAGASTQDVEIAVQLQPRSLTVSLRPPAPRGPGSRAVRHIARTVTPAPPITR